MLTTMYQARKAREETREYDSGVLAGFLIWTAMVVIIGVVLS